MESHLNRRELLVGAGVAVGGFAGLQASRADAGPPDPEVVAGVVKRVEPPKSLVIQGVDGSATIDFSDDASFWRDYPTDLNAFIPGDEVVVEGKWSDGVFAGTYLVSMFRGIEGRVTGKRGDNLTATGGTVRLTPHTQYQIGDTWTRASTARIAIGDEIDVLARSDPASGDLVAVAIFPHVHS